jgi:type IV secretion system protein VirB1
VGLVIVPFALLHVIAVCAPRVGRLTMSAIVLYESGGRPFAIGDNSARRSYYPRLRGDAVVLANRLLAAGHNIDVGYAQVNSSNFASYGVDVAAALEPCTNIGLGSRILRGDYARAKRTYGPGQAALIHAIAAYNSGSVWGGLDYARRVYAMAASVRFEREERE